MTLRLHSLFLLFVVAAADSARILAVFPAPSVSHQVVFRPIVRELARRGHDVTIITPNPTFEKLENLTEIDVHDISYAFSNQIFSLATQTDDASQIDLLFYLFYKVFETQLETDQVKRIMYDKTKKYDLLLLESCIRSTLGFSYIFKAPVIQISSFGTIEPGNYVVGSPIHPIYYPTSTFNRKLNKLTLWDKINTIYNEYRFQNIVKKYEEIENAMIKKHFGPDVPPLKELYNNIDMSFLNVHPVWESNRPVPPNVIYLGGLPQKPIKEIPTNLKSYLDSSKRGVIYISFGTNVKPSLLPPHKIQIFLAVLSKLPYDVLWKWDREDMAGKPSNVHIAQWFPQSDLLRHPKVKLFITQGGLQSTDEAITSAVPLIGIPMLADQWFNCEKYVQLGIGLRVDMDDVEEDSLMNAIKTVIEDKSYRKNVESLRLVMNDQPQTALERAIFWTEYVIKHRGARHLRSPAANVSWWQYLQLELVCVVMLVVLVVITLCYGILRSGVRLIKRDKIKLS